MGALTGPPEDGFLREFRELKEQVRKLINPAIAAASTVYNLAVPWIFRDNEGKARFSLNGDTGSQFFAFWDKLGNITVSDDAVSGQGLARPFIPFTVFNTSELSAPASSTTSGSFVSLKSMHGLKQHPRMGVDCVVVTGGGTTGEVRLKHGYGGDVIAGPVSVAAGTNAWVGLTGDVQGVHMGRISIDVEARRTGGAGTVAVLVAIAYGVES